MATTTTNNVFRMTGKAIGYLYREATKMPWSYPFVLAHTRQVVNGYGFITALAVMFRYGPCRHDAKWSWVSPGAIVATVLWLIGSALFSLYVSKVGSYDKTYGPLGAVVVFLMWLYISAFVVLLGAELNSELERQTKRDTTTGAEKPLGQREATSADTVGPARQRLPKTRKQ